MKASLENVLQQKLTRKEFIQYVGSGLMVLFGVSSLLKAIQTPLSKGTQTKVAQNSNNTSYGSQAYGGRKK